MKLRAYWDVGIDHAKKREGAQGLSVSVQVVTDCWSLDDGIQPSAAEEADLDVMSRITHGAQLADQKSTPASPRAACLMRRTTPSRLISAGGRRQSVDAGSRTS